VASFRPAVQWSSSSWRGDRDKSATGQGDKCDTHARTSSCKTASSVFFLLMGVSFRAQYPTLAKCFTLFHVQSDRNATVLVLRAKPTLSKT
jgi:hypothetical protein